jgi:membrane associated rhomboid family serine protease
MRGGHDQGSVQFAFPRPGPALKAVLIGLFALWLVYAIGLNWLGLPIEAFEFMVGKTSEVMHGQIWRLFTAPLVHMPFGDQGVWHVLTTLLGLYFLAPELERTWGAPRFLRFLLFASVFGYGLQLAVAVALPEEQSQKLVGPLWFGALPTVEAVAIAWALSFKGQVVRLMFVIPVSSRGLIIFVVAMSLLYVVAGAQRTSGLISPFGGMLVGWLLGGGTPSPLRRFWLRQRYKSLEREAEQARIDRQKRVARSGLRVIPGGGKTPADGAERKNGDDRFGPDGKLLN